MTERSDIQPNAKGWRRLSYTCRCGWVDWGHALPGSAQSLKLQMDREQSDWPQLAQMKVFLEGSAAYIVAYGQSMGAGPIQVSTTRHWIVRKGLAPQQLQSVALAIFMQASMDFEDVQGSFPFSIKTSASSYSMEDLVSNLIGFHGAFSSLSQAQLRQMCGEVSVAESYRLWDAHLPNGLGGVRNRSFRPILFPCNECTTGSTAFPGLFTSIAAEPPGTLWVKLKDRFVDGRLVNARRTIDVSREGVVTAREPGR
jgi:hypothetical protein